MEYTNCTFQNEIAIVWLGHSTNNIKFDLSNLVNGKSAGHGLKGNASDTMQAKLLLFLYPLTGSVCKSPQDVISKSETNQHLPNQFFILLVTSPANPGERRKEREESGEVWEESIPCHMPAKAKPGKSASPLTWDQSSPSSGVISVSLWTTTLVTDMSGCCSLASLIAWASAYPQEITEGQRQKGGGTCMISSKVETYELDLDSQFTNEVQRLKKKSYIVYWKVNS